MTISKPKGGGEKPVRRVKRDPFGTSRPCIDAKVASGAPRPHPNTALGVVLARHITFDPVWWEEVLALRPDWLVEPA
jgi:hypothetical protein